jgi:adenine C2-methylase RlmN of 23S rRNA A2503 and tRNA A37
MKTLTSNVDSSVNFIEKELTGFIESRYVRRRREYFIAYLSSQTGCNRGCKMCHLTATKQTQSTNCDLQDFVDQLETVFAHYDKDLPADYIHVNWMARGEPLANPTVTETGTELLIRLGQMARSRNLPIKFNVSTIMPLTMRKSLVEVFPVITPTIYYSIYSANQDFRNKWLPGAMPIDRSLKMLAEYQRFSKKIIKFHGAFIKDENDREKDVLNMLTAIQQHGIVGEFNIVRYNPFSDDQGVESPYLKQIMQLIAERMPCKIIPRVGEDVYASCGTFVGEGTI